MKKTLIPVMLMLVSIGFSSCQKCASCDNCPLGISTEFCVDDYDNKDQYDTAVSNAEALGCNCTEKLAGS